MYQTPPTTESVASALAYVLSEVGGRVGGAGAVGAVGCVGRSRGARSCGSVSVGAVGYVSVRESAFVLDPKVSVSVR